MLLSEFLIECPVINGKNIATPIEVSYYDDYSWEHIQPFEGKFFAYLDFGYVNGNDFLDGELMAIEATDLGIALHVVASDGIR